MSLARDALSSGDPVLAENYLQHAEHYNRIILAYREQQLQAGEAAASNRSRQESQSASEESDEEQGEEVANEDGERVVQPGEPQPAISAGENPRSERSERSEGRRGRQRNNSNGQQREGRGQREPRRREQRVRFGDSDQQPDFLRRSVRRSRNDENTDSEVSNGGGSDTVEVAGEQQE